MIRLVAPAAPILTAAEVRQWAQIDHTDDDSFLDGLIEAATGYLDGMDGVLGRALITQTWRLDLAAFPRGPLRLPLRPVQSITSIETVDGEDAATAFDAFRVVGDEIEATGGWAGTYPRRDAVRVTFVAGYGDTADDVPRPIRAAASMMVRHWYDNRSAVSEGDMREVPMGAWMLLEPYRTRHI